MDQHDRILDNLSTHLKNAIAKAISLATSLGHESVGPIHLVYALLSEQGAIASDILKKTNITEKSVKAHLELMAPKKDSFKPKNSSLAAVIPALNAKSKKALEKAMLLAYQRQHQFVGTEHLLSGIIHCDDPMVNTLLDEVETAKADIDEQIETVLESISKFPNLQEVSDAMGDMLDDDADDEDDDDDESPISTPRQSSSKGKPKATKGKDRNPTGLEMFAVLLTDKKAQKDIDPVIGRETEIDRLIHVLARRTKNNPVLVGEPGVGKTAIVEGLAKRIAKGEVPHSLKRKKIYSLDLALLISGTIYRGEFESRLKSIIDEVSKKDDVILFIDELHNIIGAGSNQGTMDAANILKPALARGKLRCIGATTHDEFKKYIQSDPALERRFQSIGVDEPNFDETKQIISGIRKYYERFHHVEITDEAIETAVKLSTKYIHDNFLPDKAIDLIDEASAAVKVSKKPSAKAKELHELQEKLEELEEEKQIAIEDEKFDLAMKSKSEGEKILKQVKKLEKELRKPKGKLPAVTSSHVAKVLSARLGIDPKFLEEDEWQQLTSLKPRLQKHVVGQDEAIDQIIDSLSESQLRPPANRPFASLLFAGPSGVGKTELAKCLAEELYLDKKALVRLDMSEFSESHSTSKLLGSPAGYVGHKERNKFTDKLRERPYSVVLFDEVDKAHPDVIKLLLQILDEGILKDSNGKEISFKHSIVVLTSNAASKLFSSTGIGFGDESNKTAGKLGEDHRKSIMSELKNTFSPALIGRLDAVCLFANLHEEALKEIVKRKIKQISDHLASSREYKITSTAKTIEEIVKKLYTVDLGVRHMERELQKIISTEVMKKIRSAKKNSKKSFKLEIKNGAIELN